MKAALTIAGSDPTGGAGLQADLKVFRALGVHGYSIPTALTAQSTEGVARVWPVNEHFLKSQFEVLLGDVKPDAVKTGMLYSSPAVVLTVEAVRKYELRNLVVDPVTVSSTGARLVEMGALESIRDALFPLARVITPNIYEVSVFTGINIETREEMEEGARALRELGPEVVVVTGGHFEGEETLDLYHDAEKTVALEGRKVPGEYHGTGCAFSAAVAALLAREHEPLDAVRKARELVQDAIENALRPGRGMGLLGI